ncbi:bifunctional 2-polyprenyl-6-hydroxyphenol methylase/3-demethylubiquinol 3-O-methyltransferase UbiG [Glaciecola sp. XM2]|uniref:bifunctional 2-polyprenyl-6-hydroxyphenol methylase/3-demethylubiquinol 3-O-methyltransferase UbiG n=1 Tax=Glaciecola sp. XM2 TaxID=1914931 RepID=UPI001BDF2CEC|nr:bifunctional 2-polyprenyl-6-hydroxyphenol methylase/3-demethylubiquinol 3-O-methyltransferase UbiG [Glaciecola sp. XM2]MBT1449985.1 bifunctional 2-polyprenyl-6-hydroxyphenol methylase/3-demethylubiquinol 3-O-methyltransferase UbiG [Glaciecola sp. XM2]
MLDKSQLTSVTQDKENISPEEIAKFDKLAETWWDPNGKYKTALIFNKARTEYFIEQIATHFGRNHHSIDCLKGLTILDVGSGGGLVSEALAKAGGIVTGIDASEMSVQVARRHAQKSKLDIDYQHMLAEDMLKTGKQYDVVINAEVLEHVPMPKELVRECSQMTNENGCVVLATLNRTLKSFIIGIVGAEYVMRYLPIGTHNWHMFIKPLELNSWASINRLKLIEEKGMAYNPFTKQWRLSRGLGVNYIQVYKKLPPL